jgi:ADP-ribosyl-[dinitrogen reductase] hydrolase
MYEITAIGYTSGFDLGDLVIVTAVNRGGGTDTVGAVKGAIGGARFGCDGLPERWLDEIDYRDDLLLLGRVLAATDIQAAV